jgi:cobalamin biosynthetic protein CobC
MARPIAHGGGLIAARALYPGAPEPWIDLSTGINPVAYPVPPLPAEVFARLPEPEAVAALEAVAATAYGAADPATVAAAPGTQSLIHLLPRILSARRVAVLSPTYGEHEAAWRLAGSAVFPMASLEGCGIADAVVLCNPNNPDGRHHDPDTLLAMARRLATVGSLLVVDEAFADLDGPTLVPALPSGGLLVLRSFGKTYGLAGVRLGFAIGPAWLAARLREALGPWAVSGPAIHAGMAALADVAWRQATARRLAEDARRLDATLTAAGARLVGGTRLFRLVEHPQAQAMADRLARAGILVRRFPDHPHWLRFGIPGTDDAWRRLMAALV